jgi:replicative DNA helicase
MILSCLLINSEAIEITLKLFQLRLFILKIIKKFIKLLFLCIKINYLLIFLTLITFLQDNGLLEKIGGVKVLIRTYKSNSKFSLS